MNYLSLLRSPISSLLCDASACQIVGVNSIRSHNIKLYAIIGYNRNGGCIHCISGIFARFIMVKAKRWIYPLLDTQPRPNQVMILYISFLSNLFKTAYGLSWLIIPEFVLAISTLDLWKSLQCTNIALHHWLPTYLLTCIPHLCLCKAIITLYDAMLNLFGNLNFHGQIM